MARGTNASAWLSNSNNKNQKTLAPMILNIQVREEKKSDRAAREATLWKSYRRKATREESEAGLVEQFLPLVKTVVGRLQMSLPSHVDAEDLYSAGLVGLLDAIRHYNPKLGSTFETYARVRIRGAVYDELRRMDWVPRSIHSKAKKVQEAIKVLEQKKRRVPTDLEVATALQLSLDDYHQLLEEIRPATFVCLDAAMGDEGDNSPSQYEAFADAKQENPLDGVARNEMADILGEHLQELPQMQRQVLALYYFEDMRLREIAEIFGLTESRICQIHSQAILTMRAHLQTYCEV
jgi:RNA polymerase sigma factor for flagellar operon FliA